MIRRLVKVSSIVAAGALASSLLAGAAQADTAPQPKGCNGSGTAYAPPGGAWGPESKAGAYTGGTAASYAYAVKGNVPGPVAIQGQGIPPQGGVAWYGLPAIGSAGTGQGNVPWVPNSMAMVGLKASSASINGALVGWSSPAGC